MTLRLAILLAGTLIDRLVGDPDWLWRRTTHPIVLIGRFIDILDRGLNRPDIPEAGRRRNGFLAIGFLVAAALVAGGLISAVSRALGPLGWCVEALIVAIFLAQKSLIDHVRAVETALADGGLVAGRRAVSMIVGRDPDQLDEAGVCRAAIESLAENASDGFVAPFLWYLLLGLPGLLAYKTINTADSMIGHMSERHRAFGFAAARLDDWVNWPASRLAALLIAVAHGLSRFDFRAIGLVWKIVRRDAPSHRSPNAGWPEAAVAAAIDVALGGPRRYGALIVDAPPIHRDGRRAATPQDIGRAIALFDRTSLLVMGLTALLILLSLP
ncbi:adenosylcobinamide-phosphate synthase CbiB [Aurantimonas sp. VKM B-3413]|uniref:adenosylcobinamide-phosphate synthase CbiB n=1 Tax=Aurantimonas sp. VKM B-3413 TaxID=2779401 RepID=UPI001E584AF0|nr:adenosylcobinamide-phosphate synthase CbiB [Aurantimonas sp. VKM B-3413]MCB8838645.1 adenosylcobinamide-phosphate synthase CbiB [Aurantimonas sp. VKM B-3413]